LRPQVPARKPPGAAVYGGQEAGHAITLSSRRLDLRSWRENFDAILGICRQPEFGHVKAFKFDFFRNTERTNNIHQTEDDIGEGEYINCHEGGSAHLFEKLRVIPVE